MISVTLSKTFSILRNLQNVGSNVLCSQLTKSSLRCTDDHLGIYFDWFHKLSFLRCRQSLQIFGGVTTALNTAIAGSGTTSVFTGFLKGIITGVTTDATSGNSTIDVRIVSRVSSGNTETLIDYAESSSTASYSTSSALRFVNNSGINTGTSASSPITPSTVVDWYGQQTLGLTNSTIFWKSIAPRPTSIEVEATSSPNCHWALQNQQRCRCSVSQPGDQN